jgi:hypothetical protein
MRVARQCGINYLTGYAIPTWLPITSRYPITCTTMLLLKFYPISYNIIVLSDKKKYVIRYHDVNRELYVIAYIMI